MRISLRLGLVLAVLGALGPVSVAHASVPRGERAPEVAPSAPDARFAEVLGEDESAFLTDRAHRGRALNVALAASRLDGAVIEPGEVFSFNDRVGPRTLAAGFHHAPELHDGHLHEGVGGGVCQVATGLHIASLEAGLEIVEHRAHSVPLSYAPAGLDATVYYGRIDFRVRNPHAFPVRLRAAAVDGELVVRIEGAQASAPARIETHVVRRLERNEEVIADAALGAGAREVVESGRDGVVVRVRVTRDDGETTQELVRYGSSPRVLRVGS